MRESLKKYCMRAGLEALLDEWDARRNFPLTPDDVSRGSARKVWWRCAKGHEWQAQIRSRTGGCGCPVCANREVVVGVNDLASRYPALAGEWHPTKNGTLSPDQVVFAAKRKVWWRCEKGHEWCACVLSRTQDGTGCPVCAGREIRSGENDLASRFPELAKQWHPTRNGTLLPTQVTPCCKRRVWWRCPHGHDYAAQVGMRTARNSGCPYCTGKKVLTGFNDLAAVQPELAAQWHPSLNGDLTAEMVTPGSRKKVWWQCAAGHIWKAAVYTRAGKQRRGCPACAGVTNGKRKTRYEAMLAEAAQAVG